VADRARKSNWRGRLDRADGLDLDFDSMWYGMAFEVNPSSVIQRVDKAASMLRK